MRNFGLQFDFFDIATFIVTVFVFDHHSMGDELPPPPGQNFFIFIQFLGKIGQTVGWRPPFTGWHPLWEILDPPQITMILLGR